MVLVVVGVLIWQFSVNFQRSETVISFSQFIDSVEGRNVKEVTISGNEIVGEYVSPAGPDAVSKRFRTYAPLQYEGLGNRLDEFGVVINARA
jgi:ATP-dependent Zn protease